MRIVVPIMASKPPAGFDDLNSLSNRLNVEVNVIGIVTDFLPPSRSRGTDWMCTFKITDSSITSNGEQKVKIFRPTEREMPAIKGKGDVIILFRVKVKEWSGMSLLVSSFSTSWIVFPSALIPAEPPKNNIQIKHVKDARALAPTPSQMLYAISLCNSQGRNSSSNPTELSVEPILLSSTISIPRTTGPRQKFSLLKDVTVSAYFDLVGQVVKLYPNDRRVELYITDYTSNQLLYPYEWGREAGKGSEGDGDQDIYTSRASRRKWSGPYGKMTLTVTLWTPHSYFAQSNVKEDDFVHLRNVHIKWSKDSKIEGALHTDKLSPERIEVTILKDHQDDRVKDVLRRKRDYMKKFKVQSEEFVEEQGGQERNQTDYGTDKPNKKQLRKRKRQQRERGREQQERNKKKAKTVNAEDNGQDENHLRPAVFPKLELNKNMPTRTLSSILSREDTHAYTSANGNPCTLPFQNICSRATVSVVDFFPPKLEDFAVQHRVSEFEALSDDSASDYSYDSSEGASQCQNREMKWEWRFCLLLEDASSISQKSQDRTRMKVFVMDQDAEFLLKMDAVNLRQDPKSLAQLREQLFILWGDLEERKNLEGALKERDGNLLGEDGPKTAGRGQSVGKAPRGRPFQCCIKEFGVRKGRRREADGSADEEEGEDAEMITWERTFRMFGITIM